MNRLAAARKDPLISSDPSVCNHLANNNNGCPVIINIDKSEANKEAIQIYNKEALKNQR